MATIAGTPSESSVRCGSALGSAPAARAVVGEGEQGETGGGRSGEAGSGLSEPSGEAQSGSRGEGGGGPPGHLPRPPEVGLVLLAVMILILLVGRPLQARSLILGVLVTQWVLIALPVLLLIRRGKLDGRETLSLRWMGSAALAGALLAGLSGWYLVGFVVEVLQQRFLPMPEEMEEAIRRALFAPERNVALDLLALAISPAICEELLFRGLLLRASLAALRQPAALLLNGVLFGLFHLDIYRLLPTTLLGLALALIVARSGSIFPAMIFHGVNNGVALLIGRQLARAPRARDGPHLLPVIAASTLFLIGMILATRRPRRQQQRLS